MKKTMKKVVATTLAVTSCVSLLAGCKTKIPNDENTLQIYIANFGYGIEWLDALIEGFKGEAWVQAKYPELNIPQPSWNSEKMYPIDQINSESTPVDLWFSTAGASASLVKKNAAGKSAYENLNDLFATKIPGEGEMTIAGKMQKNFLQSCDYGNKEETIGDITTEYMQFPWIAGYIGLIYNETLVQEWLGEEFEMPLTTDALIDMAETLNGVRKDETTNQFVPTMQKNGKNAPKTFALSYTTDYWTCFFNTWWAQYSGLDKVNQFNSGKIEDPDEPGVWDYSTDIFADEGRLETLKVIEDCLWYAKKSKHENKTKEELDAEDALKKDDREEYERTKTPTYNYIHSQTNSLTFDKIQERFRNGEAFFMMNGDWLEMELGGSTGGSTFKFLKTPIISSIVETMDLYTDDGTKYTDLEATKRAAYDTQLQAIVRAVDAGATELAGVSENDFEKVRTARTYVSSVGGHYAYIPSYATAKGLAKDFLLYMASDKAIKIFMEAEKGASTAFAYELDKSSTTYNSFSAFQKSRLDIVEKGQYASVGLPSRLVYFGGLATITKNNPLESRFVSQLSTDRKGAQAIFEDDIIHFTGLNSKGEGTLNETNWDLLLETAGLK